MGKLEPSARQRRGSGTTSLCRRLLAVTAAAKAHLGTTGSFSASSSSSFIWLSPPPPPPTTLFKSCSLITPQLKAIKEFSEQHPFQQCL